MRDPYEVLNIRRGADKSEVDLAYLREKEKYRELQFTTGKTGSEAAERIEEIEAAYKEVLFDLKRGESGREIYREIEELIRRDDLVAAQKLLDEISDRCAEWHYLQSIIYYKKNWHLESKKQLEFAISLEPNNMKYRNSLDTLVKIMAGRNSNPGGFRSDETYSNYNAERQPGGNGTCTGSLCGDVCLANCCCNCLLSCCR